MSNGNMTKKFSTLHELTGYISGAFKALGIQVSDLDVEQISSIIHQVMSARYRTYHNINHALALCRESRPIEVLASAFHDTIYTQVDKRIHPLLMPFTHGFEVTEKFVLTLPTLTDFDSMDPAREVYEVFGLEPGTELGPFSGINEFLSAVVAARMLLKQLNVWQRLQLIAVIEATIPFRPVDSEGLSSTDLLKIKLKKAIQVRSLEVNDSDVEQCVKGTVRIANLDVANFASKNTGEFINGTWDLCLEGNPTFRNPLYTTSQYRNALQKVEGFTSRISPRLIFRQYAGVPSDSAYKEIIDQCSENLAIQVEYLHAKLIEVGILEAIANLTGGDCPIALFFGELPSEGQHHVSALDEYLNVQLPKKAEKTRMQKVSNLLSTGRTKASYFDFKHSPIGGHIYDRLTRVEFEEQIANVKRFFSAELSSLEFLKKTPTELMLSIIDAVSEVNWIRRIKIQELKKHIVADEMK